MILLPVRSSFSLAIVEQIKEEKRRRGSKALLMGLLVKVCEYPTKKLYRIIPFSIYVLPLYTKKYTILYDVGDH